MTVLVTGGAGFIGGNFVYHMLGAHSDYKIVCVDCLTYAGNMSTLKVAMENKNFVFTNKVLFSYNKDTIISYLKGKTIKI